MTLIMHLKGNRSVMGEKTTRREFLKQMAITGVALTAFPIIGQAAEQTAKAGGKSRVVIATDAAVMPKENEIAQAVLEKMLDKSMTKLTDTKTSTEAWTKLFSPKDIVGIKIN